MHTKLTRALTLRSIRRSSVSTNLPLTFQSGSSRASRKQRSSEATPKTPFSITSLPMHRTSCLWRFTRPGAGMSDHDLIREAREWYGHGDLPSLTGNLLTRLADALEAAATRANQLEKAL